MKVVNKVWNWIMTYLQQLVPGNNAWRGAAYGLFVGGPIVAVIFLVLSSGHVSAVDFALVLFILAVPVFILVGYIMTRLLQLLGRIPLIYRWAFLSGGALLILIPTYWIGSPANLVASAYMLIVLSLIGATVAVVVRRTYHDLPPGRRIVWIAGSIFGVVGATGGLIWTFVLSGPAYTLPEQRLSSTVLLNVPDPTESGPYDVLTLSYGSGIDKQRPEFGEDATLLTGTVDGTPFLDGWEGISGWYRSRYWGFDETTLPLNGYVWYPDGDGPFPLVLIVHGNHNMADVSEGGYDYLGELLASRGYIVVSVDENFLNSSLSDLEGGLESENDARAWLLLEHLRVWHVWNVDEQNPFYQVVDVSNIALIGHSRGGEAVAIAAMFNTLSAYPDDATITFDYNYAIQSVIAIAPTDGQYQSGSRPTEIREVNYLTVQGSADSDVFFFMGAQQFDRVMVDEDTFKAAVYIYGANHAQFTRSWGRSDLGWTSGWLINLNAVMPTAEQEQIAKAMVSSFLEATLRDDDTYRGLFMEPMSGQDFLPEAVILSHYVDSTTFALSTFDEDIDVETSSHNAAHWESQSLTLWREQRPLTKVGEALRVTTFSFVGWNQTANETDDSAAYHLVFDEPPTVAYDSTLTMALAFSNENPAPDFAPEYEPPTTLDFTIIVTDKNGQVASVLLSDVSILYCQDVLGYVIEKSPLPSPRDASEPVMDTVAIPFSLFAADNAELDVTAIERISFVFDQTEAGVLVMDDVGITN
jgi:dienelactone hydrolase